METILTTNMLFPEVDSAEPAAASQPVSLDEIARLARGSDVLVESGPNPYGPAAAKPDRWATWEAALAAGQSYLCGPSISREAFLRLYRRPLLDWMVPAYTWARQNPDRVLTLNSRRFAWRVYQRSEYVVFQLPFHDSGGEKEYVSRDGVSRIKSNDD